MRYVRELRQNFMKWEHIKQPTIIRQKLHRDGNKYWSEHDNTHTHIYIYISIFNIMKLK